MYILRLRPLQLEHFLNYIHVYIYMYTCIRMCMCIYIYIYVYIMSESTAVGTSSHTPLWERLDALRSRAPISSASTLGE